MADAMQDNPGAADAAQTAGGDSKGGDIAAALAALDAAVQAVKDAAGQGQAAPAASDQGSAPDQAPTPGTRTRGDLGGFFNRP
jgi:hypothetical protein